MAVVGMTAADVLDEAPAMHPGSAVAPGGGGAVPPNHVGSSSVGTGLARVRIVVLFVGYLIVGVAAGGIFDHLDWVLVAAPVLPTLAALALVGRTGAVRALGAGAAILMSVVLGVAREGGGANDVLDALTSGIQGLLSTDWPSPIRPDLVGAVVAVTATATALSDELAIRRRFHLVPLLPLLLCYLAVIALSSPLGVTWTWLILLGATAVVFMMFRNDGTLRNRVVLLRGERRVIPLLLIAVAMVSLVAIPVSLNGRADPRRNDPAQSTAPLLDPIEATLALRDLDPPIDLYRVTPVSEGSLPLRWRTAALDTYDGRRWSPSLTFRLIGTTLGPVNGPVITADIDFLDPNLSLVPLPGDPVSVGAVVETDPERTVVRLAETPEPGDEVRIVANVAPSRSDASELGVAPRLVEEAASTLDELAEALAGDGTPLAQLQQLETTLRTEFVLDSAVQGGGLQRALIDRFLRDTRRGTPEQFASAFVLLARSLGVEARVATGFVADDSITSPSPGQRLPLSSANAEVWPEVLLDDGRWLAFDPVPPDEATDGAPPAPGPQVQTPAAPQPPIAPAPEPDTDQEEQEEDVEEVSTSALSTVVVWAIRGTVGVGVILLPFVAAGAVIAGIKYQRRRRRRRSATPRAIICGAWATATDVLVDAGLDIRRSDTDGEIASAGEPLVAGAQRDLRRLAALASAASYGSPEHPDLLAEDATRCLGTIDESMAVIRTRWQRLRWRLSLRSLRRSTRSPVVG